MDYLDVMTSALSCAKRGDDLCFITFCWFADVPNENRPELLREFLLQYVYGYTTGTNSSDNKPDDEDFDYYEKNLKDKYIDEINNMVCENLPEDVFYKKLCEFVFGDAESKISMDMFWRFYSCVLSRALPYCRVEIEKASVPPTKEYLECKENLQNELLEIDTVILSSEFDSVQKKAQAVLEIMEKRDVELERILLLEESLFLSYYTSSHWADLQEYREGNKNLEVVIEGEYIGTFSLGSEGDFNGDEFDVDYIPGKELYKACIKLDNEKQAKSFSIMRFIETNKLGTYFEQAQLLLRHIEKEADFINRVVLLTVSFTYFDKLREAL